MLNILTQKQFNEKKVEEDNKVISQLFINYLLDEIERNGLSSVSIDKDDLVNELVAFATQQQISLRSALNFNPRALATKKQGDHKSIFNDDSADDKLFPTPPTALTKFLFTHVRKGILNRYSSLLTEKSYTHKVIQKLREEDAETHRSMRNLKSILENQGYLPEYGRDGLLLSSADVDRGLGLEGKSLPEKLLSGKRIVVYPTIDTAGTTENITIERNRITAELKDAFIKVKTSSQYPNGLIYAMVLNVGGHFVEAEITLVANGSPSIELFDSRPLSSRSNDARNKLAITFLETALTQAGYGSIPIRLQINHTNEQTDGFSCPYFAARRIKQLLGEVTEIADRNIFQAKLAFIKAATQLPDLRLDDQGTVILPRIAHDSNTYREYQEIVANARAQEARIQAENVRGTPTGLQPTLVDTGRNPFGPQRETKLPTEASSPLASSQQVSEQLKDKEVNDFLLKKEFPTNKTPTAEYKALLKATLFYKFTDEATEAEAKIGQMSPQEKQIQDDAKMMRALQREELMQYYKGRTPRR